MLGRSWHAVIACGIVSAQLAVRPDRDGSVWRPLRLAALIGITVTGIVYSTVLAAIHQPHGTAETLVNLAVHYIVPVAVIAGWLAFGPRPRVDRCTVDWSLLFPVLWMAYTLVRGAVWGWYPYPFVDAASHGYLRVAANGVLVTLVSVRSRPHSPSVTAVCPPLPGRRRCNRRSCRGDFASELVCGSVDQTTATAVLAAAKSKRAGS